MGQLKIFNEKIELMQFDSIIGSGYESDVAKLALEDGVAYRAARKNMQIHSGIILKINDEFSGFFTYEVNHKGCEAEHELFFKSQGLKIYNRLRRR